MRKSHRPRADVRRLRQYELAEKLGRTGHWYWSVGSPEVDWSPEVHRLFGVAAERFESPYEQTLSKLPEAARLRLHEAIRGAVIDRTGFEMDLDFDHPDGTVHHFHIVGESDVGPDGRTAGVLGILQDVTEHRRMAAELEQAHARRQDFIEMSPDWLWEMGPDLRYTYISHQFTDALGLPTEQFVGRTRRDLIGDHELSVETEMHLAWLDQHRPFRNFEFWVTGAGGKRRCISSTGKPIFDAHGEFQGYRGIARDVTIEAVRHEEFQRANREMKAANREKSEALISLKQANALLEEQAEAMLRVQGELQHTALHDPLTGIANRRYLDERMSELAAQCHRSGSWLAVLHVDLDRFKQLNDTLGHTAGDAVLVHVADILRETVRKGDFVARIGGDEFVVVCAGCDSIGIPSEIADRIIARARQPFVFRGKECWFGASIGISTAHGRQIEPSALLVNADIALYRAKKRGRGRYEYFSAELQAEIIHTNRIADGIRAALGTGEFVPFYQPQIDARTFRIIGFEALARWQHPTEGLIPPSDFLGIAEELNVVGEIDRMIMEATVADYHRWAAQGHIVPRLSVNVSSRRLREPGLIDNLRALDLPRGALAFELLESVFLDDADDMILWNIDMLKEMSIDVELDDFGSGHASIISLIKLGPNAIKIDRELVQNVTTDPARRELVRSIIEIGRSLNVKVAAEGVETMDHATLLRNLGCDVLQGYFFSGPMRSDDVPSFIESWTERHNNCGMTA